VSSERQFWLGFNFVPGVGPVRVRQLLAHFGSLKEAWHAHQGALQEAGLDTRTRRNLIETRNKINLDVELVRLDKLGISLVTWDDHEYPQLLTDLRPVDQAPPLLYLKGSLSETDVWSVAVVGTRAVSAYGRHATHQIASGLAANRVTIVSGLAKGVDGDAHRAALEVGCRTIAVLPCGIDMIYPPEHRGLAARIIQHGALISIFPPGTPPEGKNFAPRNRVIAGLARGVLVVEAGLKSGALVTAGYALESGREVMAVPGNITAQGSSGTNQLIKEGAHTVTSAQDVLEILSIQHVNEFVAARREMPELSNDESVVLRCLDQDPLHIDEITRRCNLSSAQVSSALTLLELKGLIRSTGRMTYGRSS
jgi:DNA processing protein